MKRSHIAALFILVSLCLASCNKLTNGEPTTEKRSVGSFSAISMHNNVNVKLIQDAHPRLELTCPKNLIEKVKTEVIDNTLYIKNENDLNWIRDFDYSIDLTVYYDSLRKIEYASIGDLQSLESTPIMGMYEWEIHRDTTGAVIDSSWVRYLYLNINEGCGDIDLNLDCDRLINNFPNGTSHVTLRGKVAYSDHVTLSYGPIHAEELKSNFVRVRSESTNDVYVWAETGLRVWLYSIGNVYYKGSPATNIETCESDGRLIPL